MAEPANQFRPVSQHYFIDPSQSSKHEGVIVKISDEIFKSQAPPASLNLHSLIIEDYTQESKTASVDLGLMIKDDYKKDDASNSPTLSSPSTSSTKSRSSSSIGSMFDSVRNFMRRSPSPSLNFEQVRDNIKASIDAGNVTQAKQELHKIVDKLGEKWAKGIPYLRDQINNMDKLNTEERKALAEFIVEFTFDRLNGTSHFIVDGNFRYDGPLNYAGLKNQLKEFWIHTPEVGFKVKVFLEFLGRVEGVNEDIQIQGKDSKVVHRSDSAIIYQVPLDGALSGVKVESGKELHQSEFFELEAQRMKLVLPEGKQFEGSSEQTGNGEAVHKVIQKYDPGNCEVIEKFLTQTVMKPVSSLMWKNIQRENFKGEVAEIAPRQISTDQLPMQIEERDGKSYTTSGKIFGYRESPEGEIVKFSYVENVLVTDRSDPTKSSFYTIEYALFDPPEGQTRTGTKPQASEGLVDSIKLRREEALSALQEITQFQSLTNLS